MKNLISMRDVSTKDILKLIDLAAKIENKEVNVDMSGKLAALLFFEPSTRTHFSFETAVKKLGGNTFAMSGTSSTSVKKRRNFGRYLNDN